MAAYNCSRILADGSSCFGQMTSSGGCDPCDARVEGGGISKTRGVPSQGSLRYGPRGQRQNFRSFTGTNWQQSGRNRETMWQDGGVFQNAAGDERLLPPLMDRRTPVKPLPTGSGIIYRRFSGRDSSNMQMSVGKLLMGYLGIGLTAFVIGYSIRKGGTAAK